MVAVLVSDGGKNCGNGAGDAPYPATGFDSSSHPPRAGFREFLLKPSLFVMRRSEDRPEIEWPCRTRISCHHLVWAALGIDPRSAPAQ